MSEMEQSFEQMLDASFKTIHNGEVVEGTVIDVKPDTAILNINYKSDGILSRNEYTNDSSVDLTQVLEVGQTLEVKVLRVNDGDGQVVLSYKRLAAERGSKRIEEAFNNKEVLTAKVVQVLSGGLVVVVDESRVFIPASLASDTYEKDLTKYMGQDIDFVIIEYNLARRRYIGDAKQILMGKKEELQKQFFENVHEGDIVDGTVKNLTTFGAFVDLGGIDGLLHISEMSWGRVESPMKAFTVGQPLRVMVKEIKENKIALSLKFPDQNPWNGAEVKYAKGNIVTGKVARMADFGAFIELEPGIDALLHVSQISKEHIEKPGDVLKIGEEVTAKITEFEPEKNKISLSIKQIILDEEREKREAEKAENAGDEDVVSVNVDQMVAEAKEEAAAEAAAQEAAQKAEAAAQEAAAAEEAPAEEAAEAAQEAAAAEE